MFQIQNQSNNQKKKEKIEFRLSVFYLLLYVVSATLKRLLKSSLFSIFEMVSAHACS
jgi:hypothetical protein